MRLNNTDITADTSEAVIIERIAWVWLNIDWKTLYADSSSWRNFWTTKDSDKVNEECSEWSSFSIFQNFSVYLMMSLHSLSEMSWNCLHSSVNTSVLWDLKFVFKIAMISAVIFTSSIKTYTLYSSLFWMAVQTHICLSVQSSNQAIWVICTRFSHSERVIYWLNRIWWLIRVR